MNFPFSVLWGIWEHWLGAKICFFSTSCCSETCFTTEIPFPVDVRWRKGQLITTVIPFDWCFGIGSFHLWGLFRRVHTLILMQFWFPKADWIQTLNRWPNWWKPSSSIVIFDSHSEVTIIYPEEWFPELQDHPKSARNTPQPGRPKCPFQTTVLLTVLETYTLW